MFNSSWSKKQQLYQVHDCIHVCMANRLCCSMLSYPGCFQCNHTMGKKTFKFPQLHVLQDCINYTVHLVWVSLLLSFYSCLSGQYKTSHCIQFWHFLVSSHDFHCFASSEEYHLVWGGSTSSHDDNIMYFVSGAATSLLILLKYLTSVCLVENDAYLDHVFGMQSVKYLFCTVKN